MICKILLNIMYDDAKKHLIVRVKRSNGNKKNMLSDKGGQQRCLCITKVRGKGGTKKDVLFPLLTKSLTEESQFSRFLFSFSFSFFFLFFLPHTFLVGWKKSALLFTFALTVCLLKQNVEEKKSWKK